MPSQPATMHTPVKLEIIERPGQLVKSSVRITDEGRHTINVLANFYSADEQITYAENLVRAVNHHAALLAALQEAKEALNALSLDLKHNTGNRGTMARYAENAEERAAAALSAAQANEPAAPAPKE